MSVNSTKRPFKYMSQFKAIAADWEYFASLSDEGQLYCLSEQQIYILLVQCEYIGWLTRWYNTDDITQTTVQFVQSEVMSALMSCVDVKILTDQAELNLVDSVTNKLIESQALRDLLEERYDGTPTSINPNAPTTDFGSTGDRFDALCAGLTGFVYQFARAQADSARAGQIGGLAAVALVALLLIPGLNFFLVVGASIAVALGMGVIGVSLETAIAALTDKPALNAVICFMRDVLKDQAVTEVNWNSCLDTYPFGVGTHEAIICDFIKQSIAQNYLTILNILGQAYTGVVDGVALPDCPCDIAPWEKTFDFTIDDQGWAVTPGGYVLGTGFQSTGSGGFPYTVEIRLDITWPGDAVLERVRVGVNSTAGDAGSFRGIYYPGTANPAQIGYQLSTGAYTMDFVPNNPQPPTLAVQVSNNTVPGTNTIISVTLNGSGTEPTW